jgi:hypothetical protein
MSKTFDTTPTAKHLIALASQKWTAVGAISELVDNSLGRLRGNANKVLIIHDKREKKISVLDDGVGMDRIGRLFQLGNTIGMGAGDIGKYGSGGTMALLWLPTDVRIWTLRGGKVMRDHVSWRDYIDQYPQVNDEWEVASLRNTPTPLFELGHGTLIEMKLRPERSINADQVQRELARLYAPGLRHGKSIKWLTISSKSRSYMQTLQGEPFDLPADESKVRRFNIVLQAGDRELPVSGTVALIDDLPYKDSMISIGFGNRVIMTTRECYQSADGETRYSGAGVAGWLDLGDGWQDFLSTTKDDINDARVWAVLMHHVFEEIEPLLKQTEEDRLSVILDGIALDLSDALNGINDVDFNIEGHGAAGAGNFTDASLNTVIEPFKPLGNFMPKVVDPSRKGPYPDGKTPPATRLLIHQCPDKDIDGALCRMGVISEHENNLRIEVNKDHEVVQELLKARPLNKMALHLMVTREIASALTDHDGLLRRVLSKKVQSKLNVLSDDGARERALARLLMDSARRPKLEPDSQAA